jgi:hypothetical protein
MKIISLKDRLFESIDNVLYVFDKGLKEAGLSVNYYRKEKSEGNKRLVFIDHPSDSRYSLVAYETLSATHKEKITNRFKCPYDYVAKDPLLKMIGRNMEANNFFIQYEYSIGTKLPLKRCLQYSRGVDWLEMISKAQENSNRAIKDLGISVPQFFDHIKSLMQIEKDNGVSETYDGMQQLTADFPTSYRPLLKKVSDYITGGPKILIDKMYGNKLAAKVADEVCEAQLLTLIEDPRQYDDVLVCMMYNAWAKNNGYKVIEPPTVGVWRRKREGEIIISREGNSAYNEKYLRQVKGSGRPSPLHLVEHDDYNLNLLFQDKQEYQFNRYISIMVTDTHCDLVLGKSYHLITKEMKDTLQNMVRHAYVDAMYYIRSIVGDGNWYLPFEIKADHYASASLFPFYEKIGRFVAPAVGNKHRGYIEPFFGSPFLKRAEKLVAQDNYNGNNMSAKYSGVNPDMLDISLREKSRPMIGNQAEVIIENFFQLLRNMPDFKRTDMNAPSKQQKWLQSFSQLSIEQKRPITDEQFLLTFGVPHNPNNPIKITNRGVEPQINNGKYSYDLPEAWMYDKYPGAKVNVIYDPFDMSRVLITNHDDIRFIARTAHLQPRSLKDQYTGSRTYLNAILDEKKDQVRRVSDASAKRKQIVDLSYYNAEAMLKGGAMIKELKNNAEQRFLEGTTGSEIIDPIDPLDQM